MDASYEIKYETSFLNDLALLNVDISKEKFIKIVDKFSSKESLLRIFPRIYQQLKLNNLPNEEYRKIVIDDYIFIYKINLQTISFLKIFHQKTNYINKIYRLS